MEDTMNKVNNVLLLFSFLVIYIPAILPKLLSKYMGVQSHTFASSIKLGNYGSGELWFCLFVCLFVCFLGGFHAPKRTVSQQGRFLKVKNARAETSTFPSVPSWDVTG
jgi:hypothetical protein